MAPLRPLLLAGCLALAACSPTTPLFIAQITTHEAVEIKVLKNKRIAAAIEEEGDLLTYSAQAIRDGRSAEAERLYLTGYRDHGLSDQVRAIALYQIGLIYMNRYNDQRDDGRALDYFYRVLHEFPGTHAAARSAERIELIRQRAQEPVQKTARELLATWQPSNNLDLYAPELDADMTLLSRRAVLKNRVAEAEELYLLAVKDPGVAAGIKEKSLYQLALMYLSPANARADRDKAIGYLRQQLALFPDGELADKAVRRLDQALNLND
ncbi:hypothetical protein [Zestomonas thermotolerans]|jgi:hypothetical protein|uniref:hypothetical protein n=1 Tax=Zestomonas thermotolerans TaxID=157784 RepID=UPI000378C851|nr:hypothetical protein [Pseudomonas thermotolerans]MBO2511668.1 outer membrane assembly lipoprotein YfiO [Gammaproteobacteria bacterium]